MEFQDWGLIEYEKALELQLKLVEEVSSRDTPGLVIFCSHPAVVTLGRATKEGDVFAWNGPIKEISRGGRATYHGPSQLVVYPILNLNHPAGQRPAKDIGYFLRELEGAIVATLKEFNVAAQGRSLQKKSTEDSSSEETGVWVGRQKIASLGIGVKKWITYHGAAINLDQDSSAFQGMRPCGFSSEVMISLEELIGKKVDRVRFTNQLKKEIQIRLA